MHWDAAPTSAAILRRNDHPLARLADNAIAREYGRHSPRIYKMPPNSRAEVKIREELDVLRQKQPTPTSPSGVRQVRLSVQTAVAEFTGHQTDA